MKNWVAFVKYFSTNKRFKKTVKIERKNNKRVPNYVSLCMLEYGCYSTFSFINTLLSDYVFLRLSLLCVAIIHSMMWFVHPVLLICVIKQNNQLVNINSEASAFLTTYACIYVLSNIYTHDNL